MARVGIKTVTLIDVSDGGAGATGPSGTSTAVVYAYQRSATTLTSRPANTSTWTFSTATLSFTSPVTELGNGWLPAIPSGTDDLYIVVAIAATTGASDQILAGDWTTGQLLSETGTDGTNTAVVYAYKKSSTALASTDKPNVSRLWTFASGTFDNNNLGNSFNGLLSGAGTGSMLYACAAVASGTGTSDTVASADWSAPQLLSQDGSQGATGSTQAVVTVYIAGTTTPTTKPTGNTTYTFASGAVAFTNANSWSATPPSAATGQSIYTRLATAIGNGTTDVIADTEWSGVVKLGSTGATGINSATLSYFQWSISDTAPSLPNESVVYTFADASVPTAQNDNNGWNFGSIPAKGTNTILWQTTATAAENTATDTIATTEWSVARDISQDGSIGDPGVSNTGRYKDLQTAAETFNTNGTGSRWKIRTDTGAVPNAAGGVVVWNTSVKVLFLSSNDENGTAISDYYGTLEAGDLGRLRTDVAAGQGDISVPSFCTLTSVETTPFICDSPAGYVVFKLLSAPVRMTPTGTASDTGGVWRMSIETVRADTTPTLSTGSNVVANFGYNRVVQGADGTPGVTGAAGARGAGRFDRNFTVTTNTAYAVGSSEFNQAARCAVAGGYPFNTSGSTITCNSNATNTGGTVALVTPVKGDAVVLTVTEADGDTETRGAIHDGSGDANDDWSAFAVQIDGSLLVQGSVVAAALAVKSVTASKLDIVPADIGVGSASSGTTSRMVITNDRIEIYEGNTLRVILGKL